VSTSADGQVLAYFSDRGGHTAIWTMDMEGANQREVVRTVSNYLQLSPDGRWIAFTTWGAGRWSTLHRVAMNGGSVTELNDKLWWARPAISPDGKWIAGFHAARPSGTQMPNSIAVISADGGQPRKIIAVPSVAVDNAGVRWRDNGRILTYVEQLNDGSNIWSQPVDGGSPYQLTHLHGYQLFSFDWSRDGNQLVLARGMRAGDVVLIEDATDSHLK
jgi:Tol biopolymer transport system component